MLFGVYAGIIFVLCPKFNFSSASSVLPFEANIYLFCMFFLNVYTMSLLVLTLKVQTITCTAAIVNIGEAFHPDFIGISKS